MPRPWHSASDFDGTSSSERLHPTISYADLWTLGGAVAVELLGGPKIRHGLGRTDAPDGKTCPARVVRLRALQGTCRGYSTVVIAPPDRLSSRPRAFLTKAIATLLEPRIRSAVAIAIVLKLSRAHETGGSPMRRRVHSTCAMSSTGWYTLSRATRYRMRHNTLCDTVSRHCIPCDMVSRATWYPMQRGIPCDAVSDGLHGRASATVR